MKIIFKRIGAIILSTALFINIGISKSIVFHSSFKSFAEDGNGENLEIEKSGKIGLYDYYYWHDGKGAFDTNFKEDGGFDISWNDMGAVICKSGKSYYDENGNRTIDQSLEEEAVFEYNTSKNVGGKYYIGAECDFYINQSLLIEFLIIDDWGGVEREDINPMNLISHGNCRLITTLETENGTYDIYKYNVTGFVDGTGINIFRFFSLRKEKTSDEDGNSSGIISVNEHFEACRQKGELLRTPLNMMFLVEAWGDSGEVHVTKNNLNIVYEGISEETTTECETSVVSTSMTDSSQVSEKTTTSTESLISDEIISFVKLPEKTIYKLGENIDLSGGIVKVSDSIVLDDEYLQQMLADMKNGADLSSELFIIDSSDFNNSKVGDYKIWVALKNAPNIKGYFTVNVIDSTSGSIKIFYGDANNDMKVSIADAVTILQYIANNDKYKLTDIGRDNADCFNPGDGITSLDALSILKYDAGEIKSLPELRVNQKNSD